jgi:hypothetical protein
MQVLKALRILLPPIIILAIIQLGAVMLLRQFGHSIWPLSLLALVIINIMVFSLAVRGITRSKPNLNLPWLDYVDEIRMHVEEQHKDESRETDSRNLL